MRPLTLIAVVLGLSLVDHFMLPTEALGAAPETSEVRQNDYYCQLLKEGSSRMVTEHGDLKALCAAWGVTL